MIVIVDASVALKWLLPEDGTLEAEALLVPDLQRLAPDNVATQVAEVLWKKVMRDELDLDEAETAMDYLESGVVEFVPSRPLLPMALAMAGMSGLAVAECLGVALAEELGTVMVTLDGRVAEGMAGMPWEERVKGLTG